jgi:type I restriction enzyme, S subunit
MQTSIVNLAYIDTVPDFRIDAECYKPTHLEFEKTLSGKNIKSIGSVSSSVINFGAYSLCNHIEFLSTGVPFIVTENIKNNLIETDNFHFISKRVHALLNKSHCKKGDVLLTMAGAYLGQAATFDFDFEASSNQAVAKIALKEVAVKPHFVSTFLNCKYGQSQIERLQTGTGQPNLNLGLIKTLKVPILQESFQKTITDVVLKGIHLIRLSQEKYAQAVNLFLSDVGGDKWDATMQQSFQKGYRDYLEAQRIDAEYFQPKYDRLMQIVKNTPGGWEMLGNLVRWKKGIEVGSEVYQSSGVPFLRVSNLTKHGVEHSNEQLIPLSLYQQLKMHQPKSGEILLTKDASPGIAYYLDSGPGQMILAGGILRLILKDARINPECLTLILNSEIVQEQMERDAGGSIINHWRPDQIENTLIPIPRESCQQKIQKIVRDCFVQRQKSETIRELAKKGVEIAIELDERRAERWIAKELECLEAR